MIDFIILGLPRSATTWLANFFTTDKTLCLHDPFSYLYPLEVETYKTSKKLGISCTGAFMFPEWLKRQNCPIVVIERGIIEVNRSLRLVGMQGVSGAMIQSFYEAPGKRYRYEDIWNKEKAAEMWSFLLPDIPFDIERYEWLTEMQIQPHLGKWKPDLKIMNDLITKGALCLGDM